MTLSDFEKAKVLRHKINVDIANITTLTTIINDAYARPLTQHKYDIVFNENEELEIITDLNFVEMALEYFEREIEMLEKQFKELGGENHLC